MTMHEIKVKTNYLLLKNEDKFTAKIQSQGKFYTYTWPHVQQAYFTNEEMDAGQETCYDCPAKQLSEHNA